MATGKFWSKYQDEKKAEIICIAKKLFSHRRIEDVNVADIAHALNIGEASVYRYFGNKKSIAIAAGISYWMDIEREVMPVLCSQKFCAADGITKISMIIDAYIGLYRYHRDFLLFLDHFDGFCLKTHVKKEELYEYQESIANFYTPYIAAIECGKRDGTVRKDIDDKTAYLTVNHCMMAFLQKVASGEILEQDQSFNAEIGLIRDILISYFKK